MSTNTGDVKHSVLGQQIIDYSQLVSVKTMIEDTSKGYFLSDETGAKLIKEEQEQKNPNIYNVIKRMIEDSEAVTMKIEPGDTHPSMKVFMSDGNSVFQIKITAKDKDHGCFDVEISNQFSQDSSPNGSPKGPITQTAINKKFSTELRTMGIGGDQKPITKLVMKADNAEFDYGAIAPRQLQMSVIEKFGEAVKDGRAQQLAVMGTGSGKSFVMAGIAHAVGQGIYIVPDDDLAKEMHDDAVGKLLGVDAVYASKLSVAEFSDALQTHKHIILTANDPFFKKKAALIKDRVVLVDESHQHTFREYDMSTLKELKDNNSMLAVTGTPTGRLNVLFDKKSLVDVNVRTLMRQNLLRTVYPQEKSHIPKDSMPRELIKGYFGRDSYQTSGIGYIDPTKSKEMPDVAIDDAINRNKRRSLNEKNFIFSGDEDLKSETLKAYEQISTGTYPGIDELQQEIRVLRRDAEIEARVALMVSMPGEVRNPSELRAIAEKKVGEGLPVNLKEEIEHAQKSQIAQSINCKALGLVFNDKGDGDDYEVQFRFGNDSLKKYLTEKKGFKLSAGSHAKMTDQELGDFYRKKLADFVTGLPAEQRALYIDEVVKRAVELRKAFDGGTDLKDAIISPELINLEELKAQYTTSANKKTPKEESSAVLDRLRTGLVMHVASDKRYATGISIKSVLSEQQAITSDDDELNNVVDASQLHGRTIRNKDSIAQNSQYVMEGVQRYFPLSSILADNSNELTKAFCNDENYSIGKKAVNEFRDSGRINFQQSDPGQSPLTLAQETELKIIQVSALGHEVQIREDLIDVLEEKSHLSPEDAILLVEARKQVKKLEFEGFKQKAELVAQIDSQVDLLDFNLSEIGARDPLAEDTPKSKKDRELMKAELEDKKGELLFYKSKIEAVSFGMVERMVYEIEVEQSLVSPLSPTPKEDVSVLSGMVADRMRKLEAAKEASSRVVKSEQVIPVVPGFTERYKAHLDEKEQSVAPLERAISIDTSGVVQKAREQFDGDEPQGAPLGRQMSVDTSGIVQKAREQFGENEQQEAPLERAISVDTSGFVQKAKEQIEVIRSAGKKDEPSPDGSNSGPSTST